jgi:ATP-dependent 26S proteasome regulatory subunit
LQVSRRLLSVLLREIDGFDTSGQKAVLIGATNRRSDLDAALLSR